MTDCPTCKLAIENERLRNAARAERHASGQRCWVKEEGNEIVATILTPVSVDHYKRLLDLLIEIEKSTRENLSMDIVFALMIFASSNDELKFTGRWPYESQATCMRHGAALMARPSMKGLRFFCVPERKGHRQWTIKSAEDPISNLVSIDRKSTR